MTAPLLPVRAVIFDLDNTLWGQVQGWSALTDAWTKQMAVETGMQLEVIQEGIGVLNRTYQVHELPDIFRLHPAMQARFGGNPPKAVIERIEAKYREAEAAVQKTYDGVPEMLATLKRQGYKVILYTEANAEKLATRVRALGIENAFEAIYSTPGPSAKRTDHKPLALERVNYGLPVKQYAINNRGPKAFPQTYAMIAAQHGLDPAEVLMVGDNIIRDATVAAAAGMKTAYCKYGADTPSDLFVKSLPLYARPDLPKDADGKVIPVKPDIVLETPGALPHLIKLAARPTPKR